MRGKCHADTERGRAGGVSTTVWQFGLRSESGAAAVIARPKLGNRCRRLSRPLSLQDQLYVATPAALFRWEGGKAHGEKAVVEQDMERQGKMPAHTGL